MGEREKSRRRPASPARRRGGTAGFFAAAVLDFDHGGAHLGMSLKYRRYRGRRSGVHTLTDLRAESNYTLWLQFDDGLEGRVYLGEWVETVRHGVLSDERIFRRVAIDPVSNAVTWEGGIRLDPEVLYRDLVSKTASALH